MTLGQRIRARRLVLGLSQADVVDRLRTQSIPLTKAALSKYEVGKSEPRATILLSLARALECKAEYFLTDPKTCVQWIAFRRKAALGKTDQERIKETARERLDAHLYFQTLLGESNTPEKRTPYTIATLRDAEDVACDVRSRWNMNAWPIESVTSALEADGVITIPVSGWRRFDGLSGFADEKIPFIVSNHDVPVDRYRMNLAHELGHLLIAPTDDEKLNGSIVFRFAGALLAPAEMIFATVGKKRSQVDIRELLLLKEEYGISIQALVRRMLDLHIISQSQYREMHIRMRRSGFHVREPGDCPHPETPRDVKRMALRLISEGIMTENELIMRFPFLKGDVESTESESLWRWRDLENSTSDEREHTLKIAANAACHEYDDGGDLAGFDANDDVWEG